jgi:hypothetical protein
MGTDPLKEPACYDLSSSKPSWEHHFKSSSAHTIPAGTKPFSYNRNIYQYKKIAAIS